ncbi:site-specific integrase [Treponema primitia]|uniref:tyrosine-type recombinase/integrase n=1 Tax=Treponema primitia TaxID=88058 RepID=UPI00397F56E1
MENQVNGEKTEMDFIAQRITQAPVSDVEEMALRIAKTAPALADLNREQLELIARMVITQRLTGELSDMANLAGIDYEAEKIIFLNNAGKSKSKHTRIGYSAALTSLETWAGRAGINPLALSPAQADDYIYSLKGEGRASSSIRRDISAASSFYSFLERRHKNIKNPFRGTKARPPKKTIKKTEIPTPEEMDIIMTSIPPLEGAILAVLAGRGLRIGALPPMELWGIKYKSQSKGKDITGAFPFEVITAIKTAELDPRHPFADFTVNAIELKIKYQIKKLYEAKKINARYSCHDFRHFFAVTEYRKNKDIHRLSKLLDHAGIAVTETYLRGLGEVDI